MAQDNQKEGAVEPFVSRLDRAIKCLEVGIKEYRFEPDKMLITVKRVMLFLKAAQIAECEWSRGEDYDDEIWHSGCGKEFVLHEEATPTECEFHYCAFCGRRIKEQTARGECD